MSKKIILKFTPIDNYFFGVENKTTDGTDNYFLKSSYLPQPTTILGAIRYWLLSNANEETFKDNKILDKGKADDLIGSESFVLNSSEFKFGKLKSVSPIFLIKNNKDKIIPAPTWLDNENELIWNANLQLAILPTYNAKNYYPKQFTDGTSTISYSNIFEPFIQSHNRKNNILNKNEDSYFKTESYSLYKDYALAVEIEIDKETSYNKSTLMKIGGENKLFNVEVLDKEITLKEDAEILKHYKHSSLFKLVFTSDAYLETYNKTDVAFNYIHTKPFRSLYTNIIETNNYAAISKDKKDVIKNNLFQLIDSGATFYFESKENAENFQTKLNNDYLKKCGFNHSILLTPKNK